jgi:hexokinase
MVEQIINRIHPYYEHFAGDDRVISARRFLHERGLCLSSKRELKTLSFRYAQELTKGAKGNKEGLSLMMLDTGLSPINKEGLPIGEESLVIEIGGTNIRAAYVKINQDHEAEIDQEKGLLEIKLERTTYSSPEDFFSEVIKVLKPKLGETPPKAIGFIWSFPGTINKSDRGIDVTSTSDQIKHKFLIPNFDKQSVGKYLLDELGKEYKQDLSPTPLVVLNDTPAVLLATKSKIGGVVGTGFNLALSVLGEIFNTESGNFNIRVSHYYANQIDAMSDCPGGYLSEKQISGKWLGKMFHQIVADLIDMDLLKLSHGKTLTTFELGKILQMKVDRYALGQDYGWIDTFSYGILSMIAAKMAHRSAQIVGTMIGTIVKTFPKEFPKSEKITIPIEGSFFWHIPGYKELVQKYGQQICGRKIKFPEIDHPGILGAGTAAISLIKIK